MFPVSLKLLILNFIEMLQIQFFLYFLNGEKAIEKITQKTYILY